MPLELARVHVLLGVGLVLVLFGGGHARRLGARRLPPIVAVAGGGRGDGAAEQLFDIHRGVD